MEGEMSTHNDPALGSSPTPAATVSLPLDAAPILDTDQAQDTQSGNAMETLQADPPPMPLVDESDNEACEANSDEHEDEQDLTDIISDGQTKYDLRRAARNLKSTFHRTWIDDDKTGLYDPDEEKRRLRRRPKRPNPLLKAGGFCPWDLNDDTADDSEQPAERIPKCAPKLEVTLKFASEDGKAKFQEHVNSLPAPAELTEELFSERRLRRRDSGVAFVHTLGTSSAKRKRLPEDFPDDLTGHPIARGCWGCVTLGIRCPLLDDDRAWPCATCLDDDDQCELITPPTYKRACEHCKSKRIGCSYTYGLDHREPCDECATTGWRCIAGPAKEAFRERISYDRDWENDQWQAPKVPKPKKMPSCKRCREREQMCSFSSGDKSDVCTSCDMAGETCVPEMETKQIGRKRKRDARPKTAAGNGTGDGKGDDNAEKQPSRLSGAHPGNIEGVGTSSFFKEAMSHSLRTHPDSDDEKVEEFDERPAPKKIKSQAKKPVKPILIGSSDESSGAEDSDTPPAPKETMSKSHTKVRTDQKRRPEQSNSKGVLKTITTKFSHPIVFNHEGSEPCHFCPDIRFAMFGLGPTDVEVVVWKDGSGLEEIQGGHRGKGIENTRMCVECTTRRIPVIMCQRHELRALEDTPVHPSAKTQALTNLLSNTITGQERWCSICPSLASYECCAAGPMGKGCGLLVCEDCMVAIVSHDGDLDKALRELKDEPSEARMPGLRADCGLLGREGLLMRWVIWESRKGGA